MRLFLMVDAYGDWLKVRDALESGHALIVDQLEKCRKGKKGDTQPYKVLEDVLVSHLSCQTQALYQSLDDFLTEEDGSRSKMLEYLSLDLKDFKVKLLAFMEKPESAFAAFKNDVSARIMLEKEYLFALIERISTHPKRKMHVYEN